VTDERGGGPTIDGYRSFRPIAQGGFSIVYTAYQDRFDRTVAVKVLNADLRDAAAARRFARECRVTGKLTGHPNIITVFEGGSTGDRRPFIAMQYLPAGSIADRMRRDGPLGVADTLRVGAQIADALHAAHQAKILHRDVKPGNILLSDRGDPVLSDFGIASRGFDADLSASQDAFTLAYTAPEILQGADPTVASDLYALGATMFALLTGRPPFGGRPGDTPAHVMLRILSEGVRPIDRADVPADVERVLGSLLDRDPSRRPGTAAEVAAELGRLYAALDPTVRRSPPTPIGTPGQDIPDAPGALADDPSTGAPPDAEAIPAETTPAETIPREGGRAVDAPPAHSPPEGGRPPADNGALVPPTSATAPQAPERTRRRIRGPVVWLAVLAVIIVALLAAAVFAPRDNRPPARVAGPGTSTPAPGGFAPADLAAARPQGLAVADGGTVATLTWRNGSVSDNLVLQRSDAGGAGPIQVLPAGLTGYADRIDPARAYCFRVGAVLGVDPTSGVIAAWSGYTCIRDGVPPGS
jgi:serine/threonine protein kinase